MKILSTSLAMACLAAIAVASLCVPDGTSSPVSDTRPASAPDGGTWTADNPKVREDDTSESTDDEMGDATLGAGGVTTGTVTNSGGDLFGVTGGDQNGLGEGDCIEVKLCWRYKVYHAGGYTLVFDGEEFHQIYSHPYYSYHWKCSDPQDVCPCGYDECPTGTAPC